MFSPREHSKLRFESSCRASPSHPEGAKDRQFHSSSPHTRQPDTQGRSAWHDVMGRGFFRSFTSTRNLCEGSSGSKRVPYNLAARSLVSQPTNSGTICYRKHTMRRRASCAQASRLRNLRLRTQLLFKRRRLTKIGAAHRSEACVARRPYL
jgi:hypothetical protein